MKQHFILLLLLLFPYNFVHALAPTKPHKSHKNQTHHHNPNHKRRHKKQHNHFFPKTNCALTQVAPNKVITTINSTHPLNSTFDCALNSTFPSNNTLDITTSLNTKFNTTTRNHTFLCFGQRGEQGNKGQQGDQGDQGPTGPAGAPGPNGSNGANGPAGAPGTQGLQGFPGNPGPDGIPGDQGSTGSEGAPGPNGLPGSPGSPDIFGNTVIVSKVFGNDATCDRNSLIACLTIAVALSRALFGDTVLVSPGTYTTEPDLVIPDGVALRGLSRFGTAIVRTAVPTGTRVVTMGENTSIQDIQLIITSIGGAGVIEVTGLSFPNLTPLTSYARNINISIDNSAGDAQNNYFINGVLVEGAGTGIDPLRSNLEDSVILIQSIFSALQRVTGVRVITDVPFTVRNSNIQLLTPQATTSENFIGIDTATPTNAGSVTSQLNAINCNQCIDVFQATALTDVLKVGQTALIQSTATTTLGAGSSFAVLEYPTRIFWGAATITEGPLVFMAPGFSPDGITTVIELLVSQDAVVRNLSVRAASVTGQGFMDFFLFRNGITVIAVVSLTQAQLFEVDSRPPFTVFKGDRLSIRILFSGNPVVVTNVVVSAELY